MKTIDEQIWDYIDGHYTGSQKAEIEDKIATVFAYKQAYDENLLLQQQMEGMELEEPSMSFSRNVMELVNLEPAPKSLKTRVDQRIIRCIAAFFILPLAGIIVYTFIHADFQTKGMTFNIDVGRFITPSSLRIFFFVDMIIGFLYLDSLLRKKRA